MKIMRALLKATLIWGTQYLLRDYTSVTESHKRALNIRQEALGEDHEDTTDSYPTLGITHYMLKDYTLARVKQASTKHETKGIDHENTADKYHDVGMS